MFQELLVTAIIAMPFMAAAIAAVARGRTGAVVGMVSATTILVAVAVLVFRLPHTGVQSIGLSGWNAPLGIELYLDGIAALMLLMTAVIGFGVSCYALAYFQSTGQADQQTSSTDHQRNWFWPLWLAQWASLNTLFLSSDLFNLYIMLELLTLSSVGLVALAGTREAHVAAAKYLLFALLGSMFYLLGVALLYAQYGALSIPLLAQTVTPSVAAAAAAMLLTLGLLIKTALFPFHVWLPPAHSNAPAVVSAVLSSLVVSASFYVLVRIWFQILPPAATVAGAQMLGILGGIAIVWGGVQAIVAKRLKLLIAYSTVSQVGYLFLIFPLAVKPLSSEAINAWKAVAIFVVSHAWAKAAMFMVSGVVTKQLGHDRIAEFGGLARRLPVGFMVMALASLSLMGLPPSGSFVAKWLMLESAISRSMVWAVVIILAGGLLAAIYLFRVLRLAFETSAEQGHSVDRGCALQWSAMGLALAAIVLGFSTAPLLNLVEIGSPWSAEGWPQGGIDQPAGEP